MVQYVPFQAVVSEPIREFYRAWPEEEKEIIREAGKGLAELVNCC